jgi:hypothetical protein
MSEAPEPRRPLTEDECAIVAEVSACSPNGWVPLPRHLPTAERLRERGLLTRKLGGGGEPNYFISPDFRAAAATYSALEPQLDPAAVN